MIDINVTGRLGADAEVKQTKDGNSFYTFRLASSMGKDKQTGEDRCTWVQCNMSQVPKAEFLMKKGAIVHVAGTFYNTYTSEKTGETSLQVRAKDFQVLMTAKDPNTDERRLQEKTARVTDHNRSLENSPWDDHPGDVTSL